MGNGNTLPSGWTTVALGEVVSVSLEKMEPSSSPGSHYLGLEHVEPRTGVIIGKGIAGDVRSVSNRFRAGDVLYGKLRPYLNKVCIPDFDGLCSAELLVLHPSPAIDSHFLRYCISAPEFVEYATRNAAGINLPRVSFGVLAAYPLGLPPVSEQRRIVEEVGRLKLHARAANVELEPLAMLLGSLRQSILAAAFRGDLTADSRRGPQTKDRITKMPTGVSRAPNWQRRTLKEVVADAKFGLVRSIAQQSNEGGNLYVRMQHFDLNGIWNQEALTRVQATVREIAEYALAPGDVLFNTRNSYELVGKVAIWPGGTEPALFNNNLMRLRFRNDVLPEFMGFQMQAPAFRAQIESSKSATTSVCAIYGKDLFRQPVVVPPLEEQRVVVALIEQALERISKTTIRVRSSQQQLAELKQAVLAKAFCGELVPQDPNDEPASVLLERIRAEKVDEGTAKPRRGRRSARA